MAIVDGEMPKMSGFELAQQIQNDEQLKATPLVLLSSLSAPPVGVEIEKLGIAGCLTKPVRQSQLFDTIIGATDRTSPSELDDYSTGAGQRFVKTGSGGNRIAPTDGSLRGASFADSAAVGGR